MNWKQIWDDFDTWYQKDRKVTCKSCGRYDTNEPDWEAQMKAIQRIVNLAAKRKLHRQTK